jgi:hypothetical protein
MAKNKIPAPAAPETALEPVATEAELVEAPRPTKARVLVDVMVGDDLIRSGSLLEADADVIESLGDQVDMHPDAVAYCEKGE